MNGASDSPPQKPVMMNNVSRYVSARTYSYGVIPLRDEN